MKGTVPVTLINVNKCFTFADLVFRKEIFCGYKLLYFLACGATAVWCYYKQ